MSRFNAFTIALAGGLAAACGTDTSPTDPEGAPSPSFRTGNNAAGPGALVIRSGTAFFVTFTAPGSANLVAAGLSEGQLADFCSSGESPLGEAIEQIVIRPDGSVHDLFKARNVPLLLFPADAESICTVAPLAVGRGNYTRTDNDLFVTGGRTNSFGFRIRGQVTDASGDKHHVLVVFKGQLNRVHGARQHVKVNVN